MYEIQTGQAQRKELIMIDAVTGKRYKYLVRKAGAGESLKLSQFGREINKLEAKDKLTQNEQKQLEAMAIKALNILLGLYHPSDKKAEEYLDILDANDLAGGIKAVFDGELSDEPEKTKPDA